MSDERNNQENIRWLIEQRLRMGALEPRPSFTADDHLDADTVAAFIEGRVAEPGASVLTSHLIVCSSCRRATAQTMHLEDVIPPAAEGEVAGESSGRLRRFFRELSAGILPSSEEVVFAYQEPQSDEAEPEKTGENDTLTDEKSK